MQKEFLDIELLLKKQLTENLDFKTTIKQKDIEKIDLMNDFFLSIIKILDSFENKEENLTEKYSVDKTASKVIKSYSSIKKQLLSALSKYGVTKIEFPENRIIVGFCKVIDTEPNQNKENDTIISIIKNGYVRGSKLIREAEVIVVKN